MDVSNTDGSVEQHVFFSPRSVYQATFVFHDATHVTYGRTLADIDQGFWVNEDYELTNLSDCRYYILPHMIREIKKVPINDEKEG